MSASASTRISVSTRLSPSYQQYQPQYPEARMPASHPKRNHFPKKKKMFDHHANVSSIPITFLPPTPFSGNETYLTRCSSSSNTNAYSVIKRLSLFLFSLFTRRIMALVKRSRFGVGYHYFPYLSLVDYFFLDCRYR